MSLLTDGGIQKRDIKLWMQTLLQNSKDTEFCLTILNKLQEEALSLMQFTHVLLSYLEPKNDKAILKITCIKPLWFSQLQGLVSSQSGLWTAEYLFSSYKINPLSMEVFQEQINHSPPCSPKKTFCQPSLRRSMSSRRFMTSKCVCLCAHKF